jgi:lipid-A-disaccharide synthase
LQHNHLSERFNKKIVLVTGELSGEMHAVNLVAALRETVELDFSGIGSKRLQNAGVRIVYDYGNISLTGLSEVVKKLKYVREAYDVLKAHMEKEKPALIILVDFPGFNMRVARLAKKRGIPVVYFIPPQIWAWRESRIEHIKRYVDKVITILPFEKNLYDRHGVDACYVGHPFMNTVKPVYDRATFLEKAGIRNTQSIVTIMPGSRENEVVKHLPPLLHIIDLMKKQIKDMTVLLPLADSIDRSRVENRCEGRDNLIPLKGLTYDALAYSDIAIVASGSATLEAAILGAPTIVVYEVSRVSYLVAKMLVKVKHISLPNIIMGKEIFPEFIQNIDISGIAEKAISMIKNGRSVFEKDLTDMRARLGAHDSYRLAGEAVMQLIESEYGTLSPTP